MSQDSLQERLSDFRQLVKTIEGYAEAVNVMEWDMRTGAPRRGAEGRSEVIGMLSTEMFKLLVSERMKDHLAFLEAPGHFDALDPVNRRVVEECRKEYNRSVKIPPELHQEYVVLASKSQTVWEEAKKNADFASFQPYLEKIIKLKQDFIERWGYQEHKYNTLLDYFDPGMTVGKLDRIFGDLRKRIVPLVQAVADSNNKPDASFLRRTFDKAKQKEFGLFILKELGYNFAAGRIDESEHPFETALNLGDVRITTRYKPDDLMFALSGTIHECGHALYEQHISPDLIDTPLRAGASYGIHESQSRFWENMIGLSRPFWQRYFGDLKRIFPGDFDGVSAEQFYLAVNQAEPGFIRIEADELMYNLHIMVRYEIERALINGEVKVADLPGVWNEKYTEYLGITPPDDRVGVLQDIHWSGGDFGYFPSYALGNMYAAQFAAAMRKELTDMDGMAGQGNLTPIREWLTENIHQYGKMLTPQELVSRATGEDLNPDYLANYLEAKYKDIYKL